jgi:electron transfer flavoprotein alpha/beta subunit
MKILVPVKRVVDANVKVRVRPDGGGVDLANAKMAMNPFDEIAVEEAVRIKERGEATEIVAVSIGNAKAADTLRTALAMGADRAILVKTEANVESPNCSRRSSRARSPSLSSWANRRSTTIVIRPDKCWRACLAGRKARSPRNSN